MQLTWLPQRTAKQTACFDATTASKLTVPLLYPSSHNRHALTKNKEWLQKSSTTVPSQGQIRGIKSTVYQLSAASRLPVHWATMDGSSTRPAISFRGAVWRICTCKVVRPFEPFPRNFVGLLQSVFFGVNLSAEHRSCAGNL